MSTPTLGDLTQIPVTLRPTQGLPALGDTTVTLYNQDLTNVVYASYQQWFAPGQGNSIPIQPLGSITVSAKRAVYVAALVAVAPLLVLPEGSQVQPSPAQIAAQINALGLAKETTQQAGNTLISGVNTTLGTPAQDATVGNVATNTTGVAKDATLVGQNTAIPNNISTTGTPLLTKNTVLAQASTAIASNGTLILPSAGNFYSINQIGYEIVIQSHYTSVNGTNGFILVQLFWGDSTSGLIVDQDAFVTCTGAVGNNVLSRIRGPSKGDQLQVQILNLDSHALTVAYALLVNSRVYSNNDIVWVSPSAFVINGHTICNTPMADNQVLGVAQNAALAASGSDGWLFPPHVGPATLNVFETGVAAANITITLQPVPNNVYGAANTPWMINDVMGAGNPNKLFYQYNNSGGPTQLNIHNNGAVAASYSAIIITAET